MEKQNIGDDTQLREEMSNLRYIRYSDDKVLYNKSRKLHLLIGDRIARRAILDDSILEEEKMFTLEELRGILL